VASKKPKTTTATWATVRQLMLPFPEVEESTSYGTPALKVAGKLFARFHQDGEHVVVRMAKKTRLQWLAAKPDAFHLTDHYAAYDYVLVCLAAVDPDDLAQVLEAAWRLVAPKKVLAAYDGERQ
jgi:hypothetical protein